MPDSNIRIVSVWNGDNSYKVTNSSIRTLLNSIEFKWSDSQSNDWSMTKLFLGPDVYGLNVIRDEYLKIKNNIRDKYSITPFTVDGLKTGGKYKYALVGYSKMYGDYYIYSTHGAIFL